MTLLQMDKTVYGKRKMPLFQKCFRRVQEKKGIIKFINKIVYKISARLAGVELPFSAKIGGGLYIGHPFAITVNPAVKMGRFCCIHKGATLGQENRGTRKGAPTIGNKVWIGINAIIVGNVTIGDDVLIAANSFVNCDVPSHSVVYGNPCIIKHRDNATEGYIAKRDIFNEEGKK